MHHVFRNKSPGDVLFSLLWIGRDPRSAVTSDKRILVLSAMMEIFLLYPCGDCFDSLCDRSGISTVSGFAISCIPIASVYLVAPVTWTTITLTLSAPPPSRAASINALLICDGSVPFLKVCRMLGS